MAVEDVTSNRIEQWLAEMDCKSGTRRKALVLLSGILARAQRRHRLAVNPAQTVEKPPPSPALGIAVLSPDEVRRLVAAAASQLDGALFLTAAFTGLRMGELLALCWRDVDFGASMLCVRANCAGGGLTTPKSGKVRAVPMAPEIAQVLRVLPSVRQRHAPDDLVFPGDGGGFLDGSALRRRYKRALKDAGLAPLRFHDLRHTFGTRMIAVADIRRVQEWMGHADIQTTMRYLHYAPPREDAQLVERAFQTALGQEQPRS
jgi:integrase